MYPLQAEEQCVATWVVCACAPWYKVKAHQPAETECSPESVPESGPGLRLSYMLICSDTAARDSCLKQQGSKKQLSLPCTKSSQVATTMTGHTENHRPEDGITLMTHRLIKALPQRSKWIQLSRMVWNIHLELRSLRYSL